MISLFSKRLFSNKAIGHKSDQIERVQGYIIFMYNVGTDDTK